MPETTESPMTERVLSALIEDALYSYDEAYERIADTSSFQAAGVMTRAEGLVVKCQDGSEFQLTIVRSR